MRLLKGLFKLSVLAGLGWLVYRLVERRDAHTPLTALAPAEVPTPAPTRRPGAGRAPGGSSRPSSGPAGKAPPAAPAPPEPVAAEAWVEPVDDACPPSHPVKAKLSSGIFHVPGGRHYDRTVPDRCCQDAAAAEADGLRQSKQ
jgi:hypothetical protein